MYENTVSALQGPLSMGLRVHPETHSSHVFGVITLDTLGYQHIRRSTLR